jgi:hypothetical protein
MRRLILAVVVVLIAIAPRPASAQIEQCTKYAQLIDEVIKGTDPNAPANLVDISQAPRCLVMFLAGQDKLDRNALAAVVKLIEGSRSDKQTGASPSAGGGTSVVAQGPVARVLSVAAEYGALTESAAKQVVTVRGNLAGVPSALVQQNVFPLCVGSEATKGYCVQESLLSILERVSFAVSFDPSRPQALTAQPDTGKPAAADTQPVKFTGSGREVSAFNVRVELWNRRSITTPEFGQAWQKQVGDAMKKAANDLSSSAGDFVDAIMHLKGFDTWSAKSVASIHAAGKDRARIVDALKAALAELRDLAQSQKAQIPDFDTQVSDAVAAYSRYFLAQHNLVEPLAKKNVLAFEYANNRPPLQASTSNYRVILDYPFSKTTKLIANAAATFYNSVPPGQTIVKKYRDAQIGVELDHGLGDVAILGPAVFSVAGYYQYQRSPALLKVDPTKPFEGITFVGLSPDAKNVVAKTGDIYLAQAKLSLVPSGSNIKVPVSVTWSNRTELIDKKTLRGQIGISYDLDSLFAGLGKE